MCSSIKGELARPRPEGSKSQGDVRDTAAEACVARAATPNRSRSVAGPVSDSKPRPDGSKAQGDVRDRQRRLV